MSRSQVLALGFVFSYTSAHPAKSVFLRFSRNRSASGYFCPISRISQHPRPLHFSKSERIVARAARVSFSAMPDRPWPISSCRDRHSPSIFIWYITTISSSEFDFSSATSNLFHPLPFAIFPFSYLKAPDFSP